MEIKPNQAVTAISLAWNIGLRLPFPFISLFMNVLAFSLFLVQLLVPYQLHILYFNWFFLKKYLDGTGVAGK